MKRTLIAFASIVLWLAAASAQSADPVYTGLFSKQAISGYDTVAYFTVGEPVMGKSEYATEYNGAEWLFSSAENLALFKADPEAYAPQYGGHCAWAVAQSKTASGDPEVWAIIDGKLYLNYNKNVQARWNKDRPGFIKSANEAWPELLK